jgi:protein FAM32A
LSGFTAASRVVKDLCLGGLVGTDPASRACSTGRDCLLRAQAQAATSHRRASSHRHAATMPSTDYTSAAGGALKLKGAGIDKKKKKKKSKPADAAAEASTPANARSKSPSHAARRSVSPDSAERAITEDGGRKKTEAEKRHDERRRKRLEDRLKKEGVKTHKEKVEELNKYLSGLSEHHDMPKIGPG